MIFTVKINIFLSVISEARFKKIRRFSEGWIEFKKKKRAKWVAEKLNNAKMSTRKKSKFYDYTWNLKYLPR